MPIFFPALLSLLHVGQTIFSASQSCWRIRGARACKVHAHSGLSVRVGSLTFGDHRFYPRIQALFPGPARDPALHPPWAGL